MIAAAAQQADTLGVAAFFIGMCFFAAACAWVSDKLTKIGERKLDQARRDLERGEFFPDRRLP